MDSYKTEEIIKEMQEDLKHNMKTNDVSRGEMASKIGISRSHLSNILNKEYTGMTLSLYAKVYSALSSYTPSFINQAKEKIFSIAIVSRDSESGDIYTSSYCLKMFFVAEALGFAVSEELKKGNRSILSYSSSVLKED